MLVVGSSAHRYEDQATPDLHGEHLLERISALENALARVAVIAEQALTLALQQSAAVSANRLKLVEAYEQVSEADFERAASSRELQKTTPVARTKQTVAPKREPKNKRRTATKGKARRP